MSRLAICALLEHTYTKHEYANSTVRCFSMNAPVGIPSALKNFVQGLDLNFKRCFEIRIRFRVICLSDCDVFVIDN